MSISAFTAMVQPVASLSLFSLIRGVLKREGGREGYVSSNVSISLSPVYKAAFSINAAAGYSDRLQSSDDRLSSANILEKVR